MTDRVKISQNVDILAKVSLAPSLYYTYVIYYVKVLPITPHFPPYIYMFNKIKHFFPQFPFPFLPGHVESLRTYAFQCSYSHTWYRWKCACAQTCYMSDNCLHVFMNISHKVSGKYHHFQVQFYVMKGPATIVRSHRNGKCSLTGENGKMKCKA